MYKYYFNFRHNEKMECDLVKQHKKNKSSKKQNLSNQAIHIVNIIYEKKLNDNEIMFFI